MSSSSWVHNQDIKFLYKRDIFSSPSAPPFHRLQSSCGIITTKDVLNQNVGQSAHASPKNVPFMIMMEVACKGVTAMVSGAPYAVFHHVSVPHLSLRFPGALKTRAETEGPNIRTLTEPAAEREGLREVPVCGPQRKKETKRQKEPWQEFVANCLSYLHYRKTDRKSVNKTLLHPPRVSTFLLFMY